MSDHIATQQDVLDYLAGEALPGQLRSQIESMEDESDSLLWQVALSLQEPESPAVRSVAIPVGLFVLVGCVIGTVWWSLAIPSPAIARNSEILEQVSLDLRLALTLLQAGDTSSADSVLTESIRNLKNVDHRDGAQSIEAQCLLSSSLALSAVANGQRRNFENGKNLLQIALGKIPVTTNSPNLSPLRKRTEQLFLLCKGLLFFDEGRRFRNQDLLAEAHEALIGMGAFDDERFPLMAVQQHMLTAAVLHKRGKVVEAGLEFSIANDLLDAVSSDQQYVTLLRAINWKNEGLTRLSLRDAKGAIACYEKAISKLETVSDSQLQQACDNLTGIILNNHADVQLLASKWAAASAIRRRVALRLQLFQEDHFNLNSRDNLRLAFTRGAVEWLMQGDMERASHDYFRLAGSVDLREYDFAQVRASERICLLAIGATVDETNRPRFLDEIVAAGEAAVRARMFQSQVDVLNKGLELALPLAPSRIRPLLRELSAVQPIENPSLGR